MLPNRRLPTYGAPPSGPTYAVWETTLRCNQACRFCGTRAGKARPDELQTHECLDVVRQLAEFGVQEIALHGGETYLRPDFLELVRAISDHGMAATMVTGGRGLDANLARAAREAGMVSASVSIDGLSATHDSLRGVEGSHQTARRALRHLEDAGIAVAVNTQINRQNYRQIPDIFEEIAQHPLYGWQVQLMVPMGRAADETTLWLEPYDLLEIMPTLASLREASDARKIALWPGDNIGYFGPFEYALRRARTPEGYSTGCGGGILCIGIEANGDVKGCSAMASEGFVAGNVRKTPLRQLWEEAAELKISRCFDRSSLWGFCATCYYSDTCKAGCIWTSATILGRHGNAPYCHHRAIELLNQGKRERLVRVRAASGQLRDCALFELATEDAPEDWAAEMKALNHHTPREQP